MSVVPPSDRREVERQACSHTPLLWYLAETASRPLQARVKDVSVKGIGLVCDHAPALGTVLALHWHFGPEARWKTVPARVMRITPELNGGVLVGCQFAEALPVDDVYALLAGDDAEVTLRLRRAVQSVGALNGLIAA